MAWGCPSQLTKDPVFTRGNRQPRVHDRSFPQPDGQKEIKIDFVQMQKKETLKLPFGWEKVLYEA